MSKHAWTERPSNPPFGVPDWSSHGTFAKAETSDDDAEAGDTHAAEDAVAAPSASAEKLTVVLTELASASAALDRERATSSALRDALAEQGDALRAATEAANATSARLEAESVTIAIAIARRIIGHEVTLAPNVIVEWVREAIAAAKLDSESATVVALAPDIAAQVGAEAWGPTDPPRVVDPALRAGACEVRGAKVAIDVGVDARVDAVAEHVESLHEAA